MGKTSSLLSDFLGSAVRYISKVPGHTTDTAFISGFQAETAKPRVDLLILDESKKKLLGTLNWWQAFRRVHDVPHVSDPDAYKAQHSFDMLEPESGEGYTPEAPRPKNVVPIKSEEPQGGVVDESKGSLGAGSAVAPSAGQPSAADLDATAAEEKARAATSGAAPTPHSNS